jgi:hypothetical protein
VGLERAHLELLGEGQRLAILPLGLVGVVRVLVLGRFSICWHGARGDLAE